MWKKDNSRREQPVSRCECQCNFWKSEAETCSLERDEFPRDARVVRWKARGASGHGRSASGALLGWLDFGRDLLAIARCNSSRREEDLVCGCRGASCQSRAASSLSARRDYRPSRCEWNISRRERVSADTLFVVLYKKK